MAADKKNQTPPEREESFRLLPLWGAIPNKEETDADGRRYYYLTLYVEETDGVKWYMGAVKVYLD